jgi:hypothetical protein
MAPQTAVRTLLAAAVLAWWPAAGAETLRCNGAIAAEGDSKLSVLYKCGQPVLTDSFCAPLYVPGSLHPVPPTVVFGVFPCISVEEWLYDRGPGNLMATVRFLGGRVSNIRYDRLPQ